jgi:hypothetical protein
VVHEMAFVGHILLITIPNFKGKVPFDILNGYLQSSHFVTFLVLIHCNRQS